MATATTTTTTMMTTSPKQVDSRESCYACKFGVMESDGYETDLVCKYPRVNYVVGHVRAPQCGPEAKLYQPRPPVPTELAGKIRVMRGVAEAMKTEGLLHGNEPVEFVRILAAAEKRSVDNLIRNELTAANRIVADADGHPDPNLRDYARRLLDSLYPLPLGAVASGSSTEPAEETAERFEDFLARLAGGRE